MAISFGSSANNFGTFLGTVNSVQAARRDKDPFQVDLAAKQALELLSSHGRQMAEKDLRDQLGLPDAQFKQVIGHLQEAEMIVPIQETGQTVVLSDFASEALKFLSLS